MARPAAAPDASSVERGVWAVTSTSGEATSVCMGYFRSKRPDRTVRYGQTRDRSPSEQLPGSGAAPKAKRFSRASRGHNVAF